MPVTDQPLHVSYFSALEELQGTISTLAGALTEIRKELKEVQEQNSQLHSELETIRILMKTKATESILGHMQKQSNHNVVTSKLDTLEKLMISVLEKETLRVGGDYILGVSEREEISQESYPEEVKQLIEKKEEGVFPPPNICKLLHEGKYDVLISLFESQSMSLNYQIASDRKCTKHKDTPLPGVCFNCAIQNFFQRYMAGEFQDRN